MGHCWYYTMKWGGALSPSVKPEGGGEEKRYDSKIYGEDPIESHIYIYAWRRGRTGLKLGDKGRRTPSPSVIPVGYERKDRGGSMLRYRPTQG